MRWETPNPERSTTCPFLMGVIAETGETHRALTEDELKNMALIPPLCSRARPSPTRGTSGWSPPSTTRTT